jgi:hypothetical protein
MFHHLALKACIVTEPICFPGYRMIMITVDGTGPLLNSSYDAAMKYSFCNQIKAQMHGAAHYYRGPAGVTVLTVGRTWAGLRDILKSGERQIFLSGYSRGGAAVVELAHYLRDMNMTVEAMFLFDPVRRDYCLPNAYTIPRNVGKCYKIMRSLTGYKGNVAAVLKWDKEIWGIDPYQRGWMGNCATHLESNRTVLQQAVVDGSHGSAGGAPWPNHAPDRIATDTAAKWMTAMMQMHGVNVTLKSYFDEMLTEAANAERAHRQDWERQTDLGNHT